MAKKCVIISKYITSNVKRMFEELDARGVDYTLLRPDRISFLGKQIKEVDFVINTSPEEIVLPFINENVKVFNTCGVTCVCRDKWKTYNTLLQHDIPQPFTSESREDFKEFPFVVKDRESSLGLRCYLVHNEEELLEAESKMRAPAIYQEFISTSYGQCLKAILVNKEVVICTLRKSDGFVSNMASSYEIVTNELTQEQKELCSKVATIIGADYCGVDLLFGEDGKLIVLEVNSNAIVKNTERVTGVNVIGAYVDYILSQTK